LLITMVSLFLPPNKVLIDIKVITIVYNISGMTSL